MLEGQAAEHGERLPFRATTDLDDARRGRRLRVLAIRVGAARGPRGRRGASRSASACSGRRRSAPAASASRCARSRRWSTLAEPIAARAPRAWLINFTNPAGMVTEALQQVLGDRAIGICDTPSGLCRRVAAALGRPPERAVVRLLRPQPPRLAARRARRRRRPAARSCWPTTTALARLEEGRLFGAEWLRSLGMIPNEYLYYFYFGAETVDAIARSPAARRLPARAAGRRSTPRTATRRAGARRAGARRATSATARYMAEARSAAGVDGAHADGRRAATRARRWPCVEAIAGDARRRADPQRRQPLGAAVPRRGAPSSRCRAWSAAPAPRPVAVGDVPDHARALIDTIKAVERATIEAALTGSTALAVKALALHPLVPSVSTPRARSSPATAPGCPSWRSASHERRPRRRRPRPSSTTRSSGSRRCPGPARSASPATCCARRAAARSPRSAPRGSG